MAVQKCNRGPKKRIALKAFSIGEVLIASFVLATGLVATTALIASSLRHSIEARDVIIATELAQEGVELVRNVRDNDFANGGNGFAAFSGSRHCKIDYNDSVGSLDCAAGQGSINRYHLQYQGGYFAHFSANRERFSRYVYINYSGGGQQTAVVKSFVVWGTAGLPPSNGNTNNCVAASRCVFSELSLTNWKP